MRQTRVPFAALFLLAVGAMPGAAQTVTRGPYLQSETYGSIVVRWRTSTVTDSRVQFGAAPGSLTQSAAASQLVTEHVVTVPGLLADTQYYYSIGTSAAVLAGNDATHFFKTAPAPGTMKPTHIWVLGDSGTADANARAVRDSYYRHNGSAYTDLILMLGDNAYNSGTDQEYQNAVFNMYPAILQQSVLWATLGNHDGLSADSATQSGPYYDNFTFPKNGEAGGLPSGTEAYFSFEYGNIHFIDLESYETDRSPNGAMMNWLRNDLAQNTKQWTIAFWHHPPYTKGSHDSDTETELIEMRQNALPILEAGGVDLVLSGHSHSYERSFLLDGHYGFSNTFKSSMKKNGGDGRPTGNGAYVKPSAGAAPHEGAVYAVAGSSGQANGGPLNHPAMFISLNSLGSMVLDINGNKLDAIFLDSSGATRDSFEVVKGGAPAAPSNLTATAVSASQINLGWTDNSNNESGFAVQQSADGVTFSQIAVAGANATSYMATGLAAGTKYYFRVIANSASNGSSGPSNVANATTSGAGAPGLTGIAPSAGTQGTSVGVTLTGTGFATGATVAVSGAGVTVSNVNVASATQITASLTIAGGAATGARTVTVTTAGGTSSGVSFTVNAAGGGAPTLTQVSPSSGAPGTTVAVTLTGTNFAPGAVVHLSGSGASTNNSTVVVSATQITVTFTLAANAALGVHNVSVAEAAGTSNALPFTVGSGGTAPVLTSVTPAGGVQGNSVNVTLGGSNFVAGATVAVSGSGVTASNVNVVSATQITATLTIAGGAATGARSVTVSTGAGTSGPQGFTVNAAAVAPVLTSVTPASGVQGSSVNVSLGGSNFVAGATVAVSGPGVTASNVNVVSATQITATLTIASGAATGAYNVTVTTAGGTSGAIAFTVSAAGGGVPALTSITPSGGQQGTKVAVTINGTGFTAGTTLRLSGLGASTNNSAVVVSSTQITATFTLAANAALGVHNVTVVNTAGTSNALAFTVTP